MTKSREDVRALIRAAEADPDVAGLLLFGSAARDEPDARDVDIAVVLKPTAGADLFAKVMTYAGHSSGVRGEGLDVKVFQELPLYIQHRVLREHEVLAVFDEDALYDAVFRSIRAWERFRPHYEAYLEAVAHG